MKDNLTKATEILTNGQYTCVLCKDDEIYTSTERGVKPLVDWLDSGVDLKNFSAADKVVGKAAAFLYVLLGVKEVYAHVMSEAAICTLLKNGIYFRCDISVKNIRNRAGTGNCPMEETVWNISDPLEALEVIKTKLSRISSLDVIGGKNMSIERVREYFKSKGIDERIQEFEISSATVALAAKALHCEENRIAKTLSFHIGEKIVLIVAAGDAKIDNAKYKAQFGTKAKMLSFDEVEPLIGHAVGGVCPFAVNAGVEIYLDVSLKRFNTVFPACGSSNSAIELSLAELEKYSDYVSWVDVCKIL